MGTMEIGRQNNFPEKPKGSGPEYNNHIRKEIKRFYRTIEDFYSEIIHGTFKPVRSTDTLTHVEVMAHLSEKYRKSVGSLGYSKKNPVPPHVRASLLESARKFYEGEADILGEKGEWLD